MMENTEAKLIAEQLARFRDQMGAKMDRLEGELVHWRELDAERLQVLRSDIKNVKDDVRDHELRLRVTADGLIALRTKGSAIQVAQAVMTMVLSGIAGWLGISR